MAFCGKRGSNTHHPRVCTVFIIGNTCYARCQAQLSMRVCEAYDITMCMTLTRYAAAWCARLTLFVTVSVTSRPVSPKPHLHCTSKSPKAAAACRARIVREQQQVENMCMQEHGKDTKRQTHNKTRQESGLCAARIEEGYMQTGRSTPDSETETQNTYCAALRRAKKAQHALMCCRIDRLNTQNTQQSQATTQRTCDAVK